VDAHATVENARQRCGGAGGLRGCCGALLHGDCPGTLQRAGGVRL